MHAFPTIAHRTCPGCQRPVPVRVPVCSCGIQLHRPRPVGPHPGWLCGTVVLGAAWLIESWLLWASLLWGLGLVSVPVLLPCLLVTGPLLYLCAVQLGKHR